MIKDEPVSPGGRKREADPELSGSSGVKKREPEL
jgi:hypothetical protein